MDKTNSSPGPHQGDSYISISSHRDRCLVGQRKYQQFTGGDFLVGDDRPAAVTAAIHPFLVRSGFLSFLNSVKLAELERLKQTTAMPPPSDPVRHLVRVVFARMYEKLRLPRFFDVQHIINFARGYVLSHCLSIVFKQAFCREPVSHSVRSESHALSTRTINRYSDEAARFL